MKENQELKSKRVVTDNNQEDKYGLTSLLLILSGLIMFFFLVSGSLSDNRFGTHLVWSADLSATPMWYALLITYLAAAIVVAGVVIFIFSYKKGYGIVNAEQQKMLRIGAIALVGISAFYIALSSISFATFNSNFFTETLDGDKWNSIAPVWSLSLDGNTTTVMAFHPAIQAIVIGSLSIVSILGLIIFVAVWVSFGFKLEDKLYFSIRNGAMMLVAAGWVIFNINLMAFGALGGDAGVLVNGVLGKDIDWEHLDPVVMGEIGSTLSTWGTMSAKDAFNALKDFGELHEIEIINKLPGWTLSQTVFGPLWNNGTIFGNKLPAPLSQIMVSLGALLQNESAQNWLIHLSKPGMMEGVNESINAWLILIMLVSFLAIVPAYTFCEYKYGKNSEFSLFWKSSAYTITMISVIFFLLAWTVPYIAYSSNGVVYDASNPFNPIIDGLIHGTHNGLAPGLIGQMGQPGGIAGAIVYFSPNYHGTVTWVISLMAVVASPFISLGLAFLSVKKENKTDVKE